MFTRFVVFGSLVFSCTLPHFSSTEDCRRLSFVVGVVVVWGCVLLCLSSCVVVGLLFWVVVCGCLFVAVCVFVC